MPTTTAKFRKRTAIFKSRSDGGIYKTERHRDGSITCFCPGFVYRRTCRHVVRAKGWK